MGLQLNTLSLNAKQFDLSVVSSLGALLKVKGLDKTF